MALWCCVLLVCFAQEILGYRTPACHWFYYVSELSQSLVVQTAQAVINLIYVLLLLKKALCYSPLLSLSLHQSQLGVFNTHPSFHQLIFLVSYPFVALGGFSIQLSSHFSLCPGSPFLGWALVTDSVPAPGCGTGASLAAPLLTGSSAAPARRAPQGLHTRRAGGESWCETFPSSSQRHLAALPALLSAAKSTEQTSLLWENKHHQPKAHQANVLYNAECDTFISKYNLF